ncbi:MAG: phosphodiester glycosidase family protein [Oscillospiraceae bacterium]|jgi:exopolysaccharide biosynthesis protein|nr:phosphodiester glycosidase family protein [Oscillospiraceae bacterium]
MKRFITKPYVYAVIYSLLLVLAVTFVLLDTFVIPRSLPHSEIDSVQSESNENGNPQAANDAKITADSYSDGNITISIETSCVNDTTVYIADIQIANADHLKTALAGNTYGRNIEQTTSEMAADHNAIFAINGDYYGFREDGFVLRNGVLYRDSGDGQALIIDADGNLSVSDENDTNLSVLGAWQAFSFGPALILDGDIAVSNDDEVGRAMQSNPRTAIGQIGDLHYLFVVSDGRTSESAGLSLTELADVFKERGAKIAYNLDGGGSSTMVFMGEIVNNPTSGRRIKEREVSDIVYIGYE